MPQSVKSVYSFATGIRFRLNKTLLSESGITLTEILISLAILSFMAAVAVPNFRRYQLNQDFLTGVSGMKNDLKKVQNSFVSSVKCSGTQPTAAWELRFTSNSGATPISYVMNCYFSSASAPVAVYSRTIDSKVVVVTNGLIRGGSPGTTCLSPIILRYDSTGFGYQCSGDSNLTRNDSFTFQLMNSANTSQIKTLTVSSTGLIQEN